MTRTIVILFLVCGVLLQSKAQPTIRVGAKHFNEGYILSEMLALLLEDAGYKVDRVFNLGGTKVSFEALKNNAIDVYPEYTGTITTEILNDNTLQSIKDINTVLQSYHLEISKSYGFNNTYAVLMKQSLADSLSINTISDLRTYPRLRVGLSYEFIDRKDGWKNLAKRYALPHVPISLEHGLAYQAIAENDIDITDAYSTDGEIKKYALLLLKDDLNFFPQYQAISFYSSNLSSEVKTIVNKLGGVISGTEMQALNAKALFEDKPHQVIARDYLISKGLVARTDLGKQESMVHSILQKTWQHIQLTMLALIASVIVAVPLGIFIYRYSTFSSVVLYATGILQTIPSIALLALMIPLAGIGLLPALIALFIYALLPILRNTVMGLLTVDPTLKKVAAAIGLNSWHRLKRVELPLAMPMILTGIRTAAVINVGTATLAAFIGAGGLGEFIVTGLALNNTRLILMGAIPAALLAIVTELIFEVIEWKFIPKHLRQKI